MAEKTGILLINLGSPSAPVAREVKVFLRQLLTDSRVMDIHPLLKWVIVNCFILPFRTEKSAQMYRKIWREEGSPLLLHVNNLCTKLRKVLPEDLRIKYAMRYGKPSIADQLKEWRERGFQKFIVFPLYPQYSSSTTGSALQEFYRELGSTWNIPQFSVKIIPPFFQDPGYINATVGEGLNFLEGKSWDHVLFSFHALPERHIKMGESMSGYCLKKGYTCCEKLSWENQFCYRAQCVHTAKALAGGMGIDKDKYTISFQSHMGRQAWTRPYTDRVLRKLPSKGVKNLAVFCPSFTSDCLETLEEMGMRNAELFKQSGGENYYLAPCLNDTEAWVEAARDLILKEA
ncbi:ferrochelatase [Fibrobacterota bacterium]